MLLYLGISFLDNLDMFVFLLFPTCFCHGRFILKSKEMMPERNHEFMFHRYLQRYVKSHQHILLDT